MTRGAARLHFVAAQQRKFPQMHFTVRLLLAVDRHSLAFMTSSTTEFVWRMGVVGEQHFASWMRLERIGILFKPGSVDSQMARLAPIDAGHRLVESVAIVLVQGDLLDLGDFWESQGSKLKGDVIHHPNPLVPLSRHFV